MGYGTPTYGPVPVFPRQFLRPGAKTNPYPYSVKAAKAPSPRTAWKIPNSGAATCEKPGTGAAECGAGIAAGTKLSMPFEYSTGTSALDNEAQALQSAFASAGIDVTLKEAPVNTVVTDAFACIGKTKRRAPPVPLPSVCSVRLTLPISRITTLMATFSLVVVPP